MAKRADDRTPDLFAWTPPSPVAVRFEEERVRASTAGQRLSRSVAETLRASDRSRKEIAAAMSEFLGVEVSENMVNAYASQARETHTISLERAEALLHATGDARIFGDLLARHGFAVIEEKYLGAVEDAQLTDTIETATARRRRARAKWKGRG